MLLDSNPHLLSAKTLDYPLGYRGFFLFISFRLVIVQQAKAHFYEDLRRVSKRSLNIHMSRVNFDQQYTHLTDYWLRTSAVIHVYKARAGWNGYRMFISVYIL